MNIEIPFEFLDHKFIADVEIRITSKSYAGSGPNFNDPGSPPEGCEFSIESITVDGEPAPKWLYKAVYASDELSDAVSEAEDDYYSDDPDAERDRRMSRD